jgi:hypothetical protein
MADWLTETRIELENEFMLQHPISELGQGGIPTKSEPKIPISHTISFEIIPIKEGFSGEISGSKVFQYLEEGRVDDQMRKKPYFIPQDYMLAKGIQSRRDERLMQELLYPEETKSKFVILGGRAGILTTSAGKYMGKPVIAPVQERQEPRLSQIIMTKLLEAWSGV